MTPHKNCGNAWITGAGKGIGRALALRLAAEGWIVAVSARTESDLLSLAENAPPGRIRPFPLDVTDHAMTADCINSIEASLGPIMLAVLNAGIYQPIYAANFSATIFRDHVETNLMSIAHTLSSLLPRFIERKAGNIAVLASVAGYRGLPTSAAYGATKAALINLCEALKPELDRDNVSLQVINPGFVATPLTDRNPFPMPFLISADLAAEYIVRGLASSRFEIAFPRRFVFLMKILRFLPNKLFFAISRRMLGK